MILYTMMPREMIFPQVEEEYPVQKIVEFNGVTLAVSQTTNLEYRIERILSTDPQHYLQQDYTPGQSIKVSDLI
ncbi:YlzJ-like family protein [Fredinandcohnia quinoae]|uniref:YlzJ-like family protein n=1 Tax=Fredinandcohnia quinoae TaxID=2918902 RepID=A0AAW5E0S1_9BACI|nr:YlzJ-like family protein [Fredinandcohnia sp. SECRCQ15]MCH1623727.1 YlzJ-like family protein [Fredinandcohnia sp. SECRCQ15]